MSTRIHTFLFKGGRDTGDALGFVVTEGGRALLIYPDSQYAEQTLELSYGDVEAGHRFLGEMLDVVEGSVPS